MASHSSLPQQPQRPTATATAAPARKNILSAPAPQPTVTPAIVPSSQPTATTAPLPTAPTSLKSSELHYWYRVNRLYHYHFLTPDPMPINSISDNQSSNQIRDTPKVNAPHFTPPSITPGMPELNHSSKHCLNIDLCLVTTPVQNQTKPKEEANYGVNNLQQNSKNSSDFNSGKIPAIMITIFFINYCHSIRKSIRSFHFQFTDKWREKRFKTFILIFVELFWQKV